MRGIISKPAITKYALSLLVIGFMQSVFAISYPVLVDGVLDISVAKNMPTKISLEGDKITDVFVHPVEAVEAVIHSSGCLMILPQQGFENVHITVFGESGVSQDLVLRFTDKSAKPVRLMNFNLSDELNEETNNNLNSKR